MMMVSVILAFLRVSSRKAITPLLTASTPVIAVQPEEKTLSSSHAADHCGCGRGQRRHRRHRMRMSAAVRTHATLPTAITISSVPVNR